AAELVVGVQQRDVVGQATVGECAATDIAGVEIGETGAVAGDHAGAVDLEDVARGATAVTGDVDVVAVLGIRTVDRQRHRACGVGVDGRGTGQRRRSVDRKAVECANAGDVG